MTRIVHLTLLLVFAFGSITYAQTSIYGKVTDEETGEPIIYGSVALYKNDVLLTGTATDFDGNYNFPDIDPGSYDVEVSYTGYQTQRVTGITVLAGKANNLDVQISTGGGVVLDEVTVVEYKVPLIEQDNTTSGAVITGDQIKNLPTRNINALAATSAGLAASDEGGAITVRGSRTDATDYYVDGIRVQGALIPESEIDQLQVITGGIEAQYGDVTGGIISITTKGPSNKLSGGIELETSEYLDPYRNSLVGFNLSGPLARNKRGQSILGFRLSGRYTYQFDDDPPAIPVYEVNDDVLAELEANPIIERGDEFLVAADFLTNEDVRARDSKPDEERIQYDLIAKLDARLSQAIDITLTGAYRSTENEFTPAGGNLGARGFQIYNNNNNPFSNNEFIRGNFRFRHRLGRTGASGDAPDSRSLIQNASYTLQFGYENTQNERFDSRHGFNYFDYGYVGDFDIEWVPTFDIVIDPETLQGNYQLLDYRQVLRSYQPGTVNEVLANYNNVLNIPEGEGLNSTIGDFLVAGQFENSNVTARTDFLTDNGALTNIFANSWGFHTNVGWVSNLARQTDNDIITFQARSSFDLVPGGSDKGRHNIQLGIIYEQRIQRNYSVAPRNLWDVARQTANNHILGIEEGADTIGFIDLPDIDFGGGLVINGDSTAILEQTIAPGQDARFFRSIREALGGVPLDQYVNVDGLTPDQLSIDMFSARELNDQGLLGYFGYDHVGNEFNGTFDDFFTTRDADGIRTFPVAPNRPIYTAAYIQDKFTFRDIIFRLGVRVDRYDANTKVLKDPFSLYEIMGAEEYHNLSNVNTERPGSIGEDFKVYLNEAGTGVQAYRDGDQWYRANGNPVNDAIEIEGIRSGLVFPQYRDERAAEDPNFIKSPDFDPNVSFEDYEVQFNVMPRLAFSFPISTEANFFAHYDILVQRPPSNTLATALDYFYFTDRPGTGGNPLSNPNLRPERTIDYEIGFQQKLTNTSKFKLSAYYKELRDMIQQRTFFPVPLVNTYVTYDNQDFATVKGFTFEYDLRRTGNVSLNANYTLQFADGTGSDVNSQRGLTSRGNLRNLFPLNFDERHRINLILDWRYGSGKRYNGPRLFGSDIFANAGLNLQSVVVSGRPYTARQTPTELGGTQAVGSLNGARRPWNFTVNMRVDKSFDITPKLGMNVYVRISNLLDRRNIISVYPVTGSPDDSGYLESSFGQDALNQIENSARQVDAYLASYQWALLNPDFYSLPRRIFAGAIFNF